MARSPKSSKGSTKLPDETELSTSEVSENAAGGEDLRPGRSESSGPIEDATSEDMPESEVQEARISETESPDIEPGNVDEPEPAVAPSIGGPIPPAPASADPAASSGPGTFGLVFGGLLAGAIGFLVATFAVPDGWPNPTPPANDGLEQALADQSGRIDSLSADLAALQQAPVSDPQTVDLGPLTERLEASEGGFAEALASLETRLASMETRLAELESRPQEPAGPDGSMAMEAQMEAFRQQLDDVTAEAEARIAEAQTRASEIETAAAESAQAAERQAALATLQSALENGTAFLEPLAAFDDVPEALSQAAPEGVPTLASLQTDFPEAARSALAATQMVPEEADVTDRLAAFLRRQTNARSLAPREGDDADAVLSRAEAALNGGDLQATLDELSNLPDGAQAAMSVWITAAEKRIAAVSSLDTLRLDTN